MGDTHAVNEDDLRITRAARKVLPRFGIDASATLRLLAVGEQHVFQVDDGVERFVLRQQAPGLSGAAGTLQLEWMRAIGRETSLRVPEPIETTDGRWSVPATNSAGRAWALMRWVEGEPLKDPRAFVTPNVLERIGAAAATLHLQSSSFQSADLEAARRIDAAFLVGETSCLGDGSAEGVLATEHYTALVDAAAKVADAMDRGWRSPGAVGLIHGDLAPANWVFHDGDPGLIDFDEFGNGLFLFDLLGVLWSHVVWDDYATFRASLLRGYRHVRPLDDQMPELVDAVQAATVFPWFNNGCRLTDETERAEFLKWVPTTVAAVARLTRTAADDLEST
jgi:Ser/Thr protein kinase RdoA (MazF antagonist)